MRRLGFFAVIFSSIAVWAGTLAAGTCPHVTTVEDQRISMPDILCPGSIYCGGGEGYFEFDDRVCEGADSSRLCNDESGHCYGDLFRGECGAAVGTCEEELDGPHQHWVPCARTGGKTEDCQEE